MITKNRIDTSDILYDIPFRLKDKRSLLSISQKDVVGIVNQLTEAFLKSFRPGDLVSTAHRYGRHTLGEIAIHKEPRSNSTIINGHELVVTLALLVLYLYRSIDDSDIREELILNCEFSFDRLYPLSEDNWDSRLASAAIMTGYKPKLSNLSDISSHLILLYEDIENSLPKTLQGEALAMFGAWLPHNVLMDCVESRCESGKRLLVNAYAHEHMTGTAPH